MSGSFSSFGTALSALRYNRVAMDTASQNIANVGTEGYTRRRVESATAGTPTQPAMWSREQSTGGGVRITGLPRMADAFLDARVRTEHGRQAYLEARQTVLQRLESGIGEPGDSGVAANLGDLRRAWSDLGNNPDSAAARSQVIATGSALADAIRLQARNFGDEADDQRARLGVLVAEVNAVASDLAATNKAINAARIDGSDAGNLMDQRDLLGLRLAQLTGGEIRATDTGGLDVVVGGTVLVSGAAAGELRAGEGSPITFGMVDATGALRSGVTIAGGGIGAATVMLDDTIPAYLGGLGDLARGLADAVNALHQTGRDQAGDAGVAFFDFDPADPAGTLRVAITSGEQVAAARHDQDGRPLVNGVNADLLAELTSPDSAYQQLVNGFGTTVASGKRLLASQTMLTQQVDTSRDQLAGVNLDEEMLSLVTYQRGYEAAARVLTTLDAVLDTLINRTGLLR